jgi:glycosyltransferase involved in cell wall biosynthesis
VPVTSSVSEEKPSSAPVDAGLAEQLAGLAAEIAEMKSALAVSNQLARQLRSQLGEVQWLLYRRDHRGLRGRFTPKLFNLRQYPPRPMSLPVATAAAPASSPTIAIVTPVYNQAQWIGKAIDSVLTQRYPRLQYVVQDGGSRDGTAEIVERYRGELTACESSPDGGQTQAINRGFAKISGEIMGWLNGDDLLLPGALAYVARFFQKNPKVDLIYGHRIIVDSVDEQIGHWILPRHDPEALKWADYVPQETMFWRRRVWDAVGPLDESFQFAMDWDFLLRAQEKGFRLHRAPRFLACFRIHDSQKTGVLHDVYQREALRLRTRSFGTAVGDREALRALRHYLRRHVLYERAYKLKLVRY